MRKASSTQLVSIITVCLLSLASCHQIYIQCGECQRKDCFTGSCLRFSSEHGYYQEQVCTEMKDGCPQGFPVRFFSRRCDETRCPSKCCIDEDPLFSKEVCLVNPNIVDGSRLCEQGYNIIVILITIGCLVLIGLAGLYVLMKEQSKNKSMEMELKSETYRDSASQVSGGSAGKGKLGARI